MMEEWKQDEDLLISMLAEKYLFTMMESKASYAFLWPLVQLVEPWCRRCALYHRAFKHTIETLNPQQAAKINNNKSRRGRKFPFGGVFWSIYIWILKHSFLIQTYRALNNIWINI